MTTKYSLEAHNIYKTFKNDTAKVEVLRGVSLSVLPGETVAIMGASGEGKSTLLHILGLIESPSQGEVHISGAPVPRFKKSMIRNKNIGFIFQSYNLLNHYTVLENILMPARISRSSVGKKSAHYDKAWEMLKTIGLEDRAHFDINVLSGGEKQRVALARAFCNDPGIILADEPTGNLDHHTSTVIHDLLISCSKKSGKSLVIVTHDKELAELCDTTYILQDGAFQKG
jgi:lipoprotein-releasing system ATP-binding protein